MQIFLTSSANLVMDLIVPRLPKKPQDLKVLFITTAGNPYDEKPWQVDDHKKLEELGFSIVDCDLVDKNEEEVKRAVDEVDVIFVAGGNTFYLLEHANKSGFSKVVRELKDSDKIYIGSSAGSCVAGPDLEPIAPIDEPEKANLESTRAFELVNFVVIPHFGREKYAPYHEKALEYGDRYKLVTLADDEFIEQGNQ